MRQADTVKGLPGETEARYMRTLPEQPAAETPAPFATSFLQTETPTAVAALLSTYAKRTDFFGRHHKNVTIRWKVVSGHDLQGKGPL